MNSKKVITKLKQQYPEKTIINNLDNKGKISEVICEIEPTEDHPEYSLTVAVIDNSIMHFHKKTEETYKVLTGQLTIVTDTKIIKLKAGEEVTIKPGTVHANIGKETWVEVTSKPGWTLGDHIPLTNLVKEVVANLNK
jgi:mannose-6-phosphate isomerase-like protein (cupin superfamily)